MFFSLMFVNKCLEIFNKSREARGYQNMSFFFKVLQITLDLSVGMLTGPLNTLAFK